MGSARARDGGTPCTGLISCSQTGIKVLNKCGCPVKLYASKTGTQNGMKKKYKGKNCLKVRGHKKYILGQNYIFQKKKIKSKSKNPSTGYLEDLYEG